MSDDIARWEDGTPRASLLPRLDQPIHVAWQCPYTPVPRVVDATVCPSGECDLAPGHLHLAQDFADCAWLDVCMDYYGDADLCRLCRRDAQSYAHEREWLQAQRYQ